MIDAIIEKIHSEFGNNYRIYTENVEQGLKTPCFSIFPLSASGNRFLENRYSNNYQFMVQFFPNTKNAYAECLAMLKKLLMLLVDVGKYHATTLNGEVVDSVLHFEVVYNEFLLDLPDDEVMQEHKLDFERMK